MRPPLPDNAPGRINARRAVRPLLPGPVARIIR